VSRISSLDPGYVTGQLSVFPEAVDTPSVLYHPTNNASTTLKHGVAYNGTSFIVNDTSTFPSDGLIRVGPQSGPGDSELVYYGSKTTNQFLQLQRGFAGTRINPWPSGSFVTASVTADQHNAIKDAVIQMEGDLGVSVNPTATSLNGILQALEAEFLSPKPLFWAYPLNGVPPLTVTFQNFSGGQPLKFLWDFGDGTTTTDRAPVHTYVNEGNYTVSMSMQTTTGAQGITTKSNYISVSVDNFTPFFYFLPQQGYSVQTAADRTARGIPTTPTTFSFVDQTDAPIAQRFWIFDDGQTDSEPNPDIHTTSHVYNQPGVYSPTLLIVLGDQSQRSASLSEQLVVL
jgi:PKD repeat protein